jgi:hypothetical protein
MRNEIQTEGERVNPISPINPYLPENIRSKIEERYQTPSEESTTKARRS